jgi:RNA polymerase sigma-70 factor, ECF subfamily
MAATEWDAATFGAHRPLLFSIAYRMLGSASEAEDIIQDAWLRARQDEHADVRSPRAYLTTIVTRLCIDRLRSAERTRMEYPGPWLPEPLTEPNQESVELASSLTTAFLVLLQRLGPTERAVFLLREVFELDFDEIAKAVGKTEANTRQILTRARGRLRDSRRRFTVSRDESEEVVRRFRHAYATGDVAELMAVLKSDATLVVDGGGKAPAATSPVVGADRIAAFVVDLVNKTHWSESDFQLVTINSAPGLLMHHPTFGDTTYSFDIADGRIRAIYAVRNPDKLRRFLERTQGE